MRALFFLLVLIIAFVGGLVLEPHASFNWGLSPSLEQTRDSMGLCGGTKQTMCGDQGVGPGGTDLVPAPIGTGPEEPVDPAAPVAPPAP